MLSAPSSRANATQSSIARSGSASRICRGVNSCSAAVRTQIFMYCGANGLTDILLFWTLMSLEFENAIKLFYLLSGRALIYCVLIESVSHLGKYGLQIPRQIISRS